MQRAAAVAMVRTQEACTEGLVMASLFVCLFTALPCPPLDVDLLALGLPSLHELYEAGTGAARELDG